MYDMVGMKFKEYFEGNYNDALKSFQKIKASSDGINDVNVETALKSLIYFCFDFGIASGEDVEKRNKIRDSFLSAMNFSEDESEEIENNIIRLSI